MLASRCGQILNKTELAGSLGVSAPTIGEWLSILEITGQIILVPPFYENFGKRLIKSPKLYFMDSGLACHLLAIESEIMLTKSPFLGAMFEGYLASELVKAQTASGRPREVYYFRDQQGLEVDFIIPRGSRPSGISRVQSLEDGQTQRCGAFETPARCGIAIIAVPSGLLSCTPGKEQRNCDRDCVPGSKSFTPEALLRDLYPRIALF